LGGGCGFWFFDWQQVSFHTGIIKADAEEVREWEIFTVHPCDGEYFALQSHHGAYLCAEETGDHDVIANRFEIRSWEKFRFIAQEEHDSNDSVWRGYFQSKHGTFMTTNHPHCHLTANALDISQAELFEVYVQA